MNRNYVLQILGLRKNKRKLRHKYGGNRTEFYLVLIKTND